MGDWIGKKIGNFTVTGVLGSGAHGVVYAARHDVLRHAAAIKVLRLSAADTPTARHAVERFKAEARALIDVTHPNVIRLYDFGEIDRAHLYFAMEHLAGRDLEQELQLRSGVPFSATEVLPYLASIVAGLEAAHAEQVIHRDLKPANIFVVEGNAARLKLLDFGIAKRLDRAQSITAPGMGSPLYAAPEQVLGHQAAIGPATDVYSLGVILYRMLSGQLPFDVPINATAQQQLLLPSRVAPIPLRKRAPGVSRPVARLVDRCLRPSPERRPATPLAVLQAYRAAVAPDALDAPSAGTIDEATLEPESADLDAVASPRSRPRRMPQLSPSKWLSLGALSVVLVAALWAGRVVLDEHLAASGSQVGQSAGSDTESSPGATLAGGSGPSNVLPAKPTSRAAEPLRVAAPPLTEQAPRTEQREASHVTQSRSARVRPRSKRRGSGRALRRKTRSSRSAQAQAHASPTPESSAKTPLETDTSAGRRPPQALDDPSADWIQAVEFEAVAVAEEAN